MVSFLTVVAAVSAVLAAIFFVRLLVVVRGDRRRWARSASVSGIGALWLLLLLPVKFFVEPRVSDGALAVIVLVLVVPGVALLIVGERIKYRSSHE
jgi:hypothetical protein